MVPSAKDIKEFVLVEKIAERFKTKDKSVVVSIGDDAAVVAGPPGKHLLYTADMLIESVHFRRTDDPEKVGYKSLAVSVSDIAAMGGVPKYALVSVGLPKQNLNLLTRRLFSGIKRCAEIFGISVIGGDTNRSPRLVIDTVVAGEVEKESLVLRRGARPGDHIFVSGPLGGSLRGKHLTFVPRVREARYLARNFKPTSMIDLSDGLAMDLHRLVRASGVGALLVEDSIPKSQGVRRTQAALFDGEDFELLFTLDPGRHSLAISRGQGGSPFRFYRIGAITDHFSGVKMQTADGRICDIPCRGFAHF